MFIEDVHINFLSEELIDFPHIRFEVGSVHCLCTFGQSLDDFGLMLGLSGCFLRVSRTISSRLRLARSVLHELN